MDKSGNILAVDDDALNRDVIERIVARRGHSVTLARNGKDALYKIKRGAFDLVLLDVMMPGIDGLDVLREIRHHYSMLVLPVIMVSALSDSDKVVELLESGANDYMTKPIDAKVLQARVKTQLSVVMENKEIFVLSEDEKRCNKRLSNLSDCYVSENVERNVACCKKVKEEEKKGLFTANCYSY